MQPLQETRPFKDLDQLPLQKAINFPVFKPLFGLHTTGGQYRLHLSSFAHTAMVILII